MCPTCLWGRSLLRWRYCESWKAAENADATSSPHEGKKSRPLAPTWRNMILCLAVFSLEVRCSPHSKSPDIIMLRISHLQLCWSVGHCLLYLVCLLCCNSKGRLLIVPGDIYKPIYTAWASSWFPINLLLCIDTSEIIFGGLALFLICASLISRHNLLSQVARVLHNSSDLLRSCCHGSLCLA